MSAIEQYLEQLSIGDAQEHENLVLYPLLGGETRDQPYYLLLDDALEKDLARVSEVSESGEVPELKFVNGADQPVLLLDGEEITGAKQNRIINLSILVPANTTINIPVSCVEAGRWRKESDYFTSAKRAYFSRGRAKKAAQVSESMCSSGSRCSDQAQVWDDISAKFSRMKSSSRTQATAQMYQDNAKSLAEYEQAYSPVEHQVGSLFAINGKIVGMDLFDNAMTYARQLPKLIQSYALDAIDEGQSQDELSQNDDVGEMIQSIHDAEVSKFNAVGLGEDYRLRNEDITGGVLVNEDQVVHLMAFRMGVSDMKPRPRGLSSIARYSRRRHMRTH